MKDTRVPDWYNTNRQPAFIRHGAGPMNAPFGTPKYPWGNMPALNILQLKDNEGETEVNRDFKLLFAASGDLRNAIKSVDGLPHGYKGECVAVLNDKDLTIVARNAIMLMIALRFPPKAAVPMIIHLWYSALLPAVMVDTIQSDILPLFQDVCSKIEDKPQNSLQAKTFNFDGRKLRMVLKKQEWDQLVKFCQVPPGLTASEAQIIRRRIMLAPERVDFQDKVMLDLTKAGRQGEMYFRERGILLPHSCSTKDFDTPNPASPRGGWSYPDYMKNAPPATADEFGAIFYYIRNLLLRFCGIVQSSQISFHLLCVDATLLGDYPYVDDMKFDRIEISNICDGEFVGPPICIDRFSRLLKPRSENPHATLLMLFLNAAAATEYVHNSDSNAQETEVAMDRLAHYMPYDEASLLNAVLHTSRTGVEHPILVHRASCAAKLKDWVNYFDIFIRETNIPEFAQLCGLVIKEEHTIVQPWPYLVRLTTTRQEFEILMASERSGHERYIEFRRVE
ncbi:hypothetical protein N0V83_008497 [Neocucurbitaria cava]|uniref:DUF4470 domain-containing protein n=1 Tax=Neocucurbitaria cava TaxID=798079 RepID=A0A9W8Y391_9PLEO|nr:hypothetical protein N0V83_008497 [Neocucurbitaria cava]